MELRPETQVQLHALGMSGIKPMLLVLGPLVVTPSVATSSRAGNGDSIPELHWEWLCQDRLGPGP